MAVLLPNFSWQSENCVAYRVLVPQMLFTLRHNAKASWIGIALLQEFAIMLSGRGRSLWMGSVIKNIIAAFTTGPGLPFNRITTVFTDVRCQLDRLQR